MNDSFDYVIVGAGSAGCVLANRLTANPRNRVLLIEAGGWDRHPYLKLPLGWGRILRDRLYDWGYDTEPEVEMAGRRIEVARGKVIGGSSSINAMAYVRGNAADYDRWASKGLPGWSHDDVLPYFRRQETWESGESAYRGGEGPLATVTSRYADPLIEAYFAAAAEAGYPFNEDYNGVSQDGFARLQSTIRKGRRESAATAYLHPVLGRDNLTVWTDCLSNRVVFEGGRATGVDYTRKGVRKIVEAEKEVILCAGAINSPQILMLSGIGDPAELGKHDIAVRCPLPGVGKNLQDHVAALLMYSRRDESPFLRHMRLDRLGTAAAAGFLLGTGFATDLPSGMTAFIKSTDREPVPDIQLLFMAGSLAGRPYMPPFSKPFADTFACRIVLLRPESRGVVALSSANPEQHPRILQRLLTAESDWSKLSAAINIFRDLARSPRLSSHMAGEVGPGSAVTSDQELQSYVRSTAITAHHPFGTCRMGPSSDAASVVDGELRVHGLEGLRVVDAAVFPDQIGGAINAPVMMVAERAADLILKRTEPVQGSTSPTAR